MIVSERGNLTGGIFLSPSRMSTVKIRTRSLFRTPLSRIGAVGADSGLGADGGIAFFHDQSLIPATVSPPDHRRQEEHLG